MNNDNHPQKEDMLRHSAVTREVVDALRAGDHNAFAKIFLYYQSPLENFLIKLTGSREDGQEIFQEVFTTLWEKREGIDPSKSIKSYLFTMARNSALNHIRKSGRFDDMQTDYEYTIVGDNISADEELIARETQLLLEIAVRNMPRQRQEIYRMYLEGRSYDEIADKLDITRNNVQRQISNARKDVRELIYLILFFMMA